MRCSNDGLRCLVDIALGRIRERWCTGVLSSRRRSGLEVDLRTVDDHLPEEMIETVSNTASVTFWIGGETVDLIDSKSLDVPHHGPCKHHPIVLDIPHD